MERMSADALTVFQRYSELMTYVPEKPDKKFKFDPNKLKYGITVEDYVSRKFITDVD